MYTLLIILTILAALLLIGAVLIQRSKGGGLSSSFAGSNQIMGVRAFVMPTGAERVGSRVEAVATQQVVEGGNFDTQAPAAQAPAAPAAQAPAPEAPAAPAE